MSLKLLSLHLGLMQKAVTLNTQYMPYNLKVFRIIMNRNNNNDDDDDGTVTAK